MRLALAVAATLVAFSAPAWAEPDLTGFWNLSFGAVQPPPEMLAELPPNTALIDDTPHTKMGHSVGHWEGDELVVDTTHIAPSTITNNGLDHSADIHMVERYRLSADGKRLMATEWFEDPAVLDNAGARFIQWEKHPGQYVYPYECDPSFALEYQQVGQGSQP